LSAVLVGNSVALNADSSRTVATANGSVTLFPDGRFLYTPLANFNGTDSFQYRVEDNGGTANGGNDGTNPASSPVTVTITVVAVNDAPINTLPGTAQSTNEDTLMTFSTGGSNQISVGDIDAAASPIRTTVSVTNGTLTLAPFSGLTFSAGDGTADTTMTFAGSATSINAALNGMSFAPSSNFNGTAVLTISTNDQGNTGLGGALADTDTLNITVNAVNDAPVNSVPGAQITNDEDPVTFSQSRGNLISIGDIDAASSIVRLTLFPLGGSLQMATQSGLALVQGDGAAGIGFTFDGTIAALNNALNGMVFRPTTEFNGTASLGITTNDQGNTGIGGAQFDSDTINITVSDVNDAPVNVVPAVQTLSEEESITFNSANGNRVSVTDVDARTGELRVVLTAANGTLTLGGTTGLTFSAGDGINDTQMSFTGTLVNLQNALNNLSFAPNLNFNGSASVTMTTDDRGNSGAGSALSDTDTMFLTVIPVNDPPVIGTEVNLAIAISGQPFTISYAGLASRLSATDPDGDTIQFRVTSVPNGTLTKNGDPVVLGVTAIGPNESFVWTPPQNVNLKVTAFTVQAVDSSGNPSTNTSTNTATVNIDTATITRYLRAYNPRTDYHFFTMSQGEFDNAVRALGYRDETTGRPGFAVATGPAPLTHAIHRLYNPNNNRHYYTADSFERDVLVSIGYRYEKDEGFIFTTQVPGSSTIYRLYNNNSGTHLLTESAAQRDAILAQFPGIWVRHADFGFAFPVSASGIPPVTAVARRAAEALVSAASPTVGSATGVRNSETSVSSLMATSLPRSASANSASPVFEHIGPTNPTPAVRTDVRSADDAEELDGFWQEVGRQLELGMDLSDDLNAVLVGR
jgi:hypothetical protein